jgi:hypothetical protein
VRLIDVDKELRIGRLALVEARLRTRTTQLSLIARSISRLRRRMWDGKYVLDVLDPFALVLGQAISFTTLAVS